MSVADRLNKLSTDITNAYTSINNKGGTIPANKNTNNLSTAIDSIQSSNIIGATAEGESLSLTNTKAMPYSDYVVEGKSEQDGEPSPSNPSEIHSVADDVNLLNLDDCTFENCTLNEDGSIKSNINNSYFCAIETTQLNSFLMQNLGESFTFSIKDAIENKQISIVVYGSRTGGGTYQEATVYSTSRKVTIPLANNFTNITKIAFRVNRSSTPFTDTTTVIKELKFEKGSTATPYSPYNQGTVTIKQRGTTESDDYTLQTSPLRSLPNGVKDTIEEDGIHRRVGRVVLDGSESSWSSYSQGFQYTYNISISDCKVGYQKSLCSHFKNSNQTWEPANGKVGQYSDHPTITNKYFNTDKSTLASWKEWLQQNPITLIYELAEEVIEPLTQNQATTMLDIIKTGSYEGTTNIYTDEDVKPTIGVGYYKKG